MTRLAATLAALLLATPLLADAHKPGCAKYPEATQHQYPDCAD
ncbi:hypothetical protein [Jannaschia sp. Os4]|nr:hypothetical protein [Jannaschia sp. Os4]